MMNDYTEEQIDEAALKLAEEVRDIRQWAAVTPARPDVVYLADASQISNIGLSGAQFEEVLAEQRVAVMFDKLDDFFSKHKVTLVLCCFGIGLSVGLPFFAIMMGKI
jgi:hypothetical protein